MKERTRAGLSIFMVALISFSSISVYMYADGVSGTLDCNLLWPEDNKKNIEGAIEIRTANDLMKIGRADSHPLNGHYIQMEDIDFNEAVYDEGYIKGFEIELSYINGQFELLYNGAVIKVKIGAIDINGKIKVLSNEDAIYTFNEEREVKIVAGGEVSEDFQNIGGKTFSVTFSGKVNEISGQKKNSEGNFHPIGSFKGTYDGNFHYIKGIEVSKYSKIKETIGIFSEISGGMVKNLDLRDGEITVVVGEMSEYGIYIGTIAGCSKLSVISNCHTDVSLNVLSFVNGDTVWVGGMFGDVDNSTIEYCYNSGDICVFAYSENGSTSVSIGGLTGRMRMNFSQTGNHFLFCYNTGNMEFKVMSESMDSKHYATARAGGIAGQGYYEISNCYNTGSITANIIGEHVGCGIYAGGLVGTDLGGKVTNCHNNGDITIHGNTFYYFGLGGLVGEIFDSVYLNCYNVGMLINDFDETDKTLIGGIAGVGNYGYPPIVKNCYFVPKNEKNNDLKICGGEYNEGKDAEFDKIENCGKLVSGSIADKNNYHEWDFDHVWDFRDVDLPNLRFPVAIEATASEGGKITNKGTTVKPYGDSFEYAFIPDAGYKVLEVVIDGETIGEVSEYTFSNVDTTHSIHVTFQKIDAGTDDKGTKCSFWIWPYILMLIIFISALCCWYRDDRKERK